MTRKAKYLLQAGLFLLIFIGLLLVATFLDLEISHLLAGNGLDDYSYYSNDLGGRFIEYIGSFPIFIFGIFACLVFMHKIYSFNDKKKYLAIIFIPVILVLSEMLVGDTLKYYCRFHDMEDFYEATLTKIILYIIAALITSLLIFFYRKVDQEKNNKLLGFAVVIFGTCIGYLIITIVKTPVGRMRYRAMNLINDFSFYTPWYKISEAKHILEGSIVPKDGFKSFPSGHTFSAGVCYVLICMPCLYKKFGTRNWKIFWYVLPITYTGLVGFYRIVVGAHYLSDVLVGGTIAYVLAELFKYIVFIRNEKEA